MSETGGRAKDPFEKAAHAAAGPSGPSLVEHVTFDSSPKTIRFFPEDSYASPE